MTDRFQPGDHVRRRADVPQNGSWPNETPFRVVRNESVDDPSTSSERHGWDRIVDSDGHRHFSRNLEFVPTWQDANVPERPWGVVGTTAGSPVIHHQANNLDLVETPVAVPRKLGEKPADPETIGIDDERIAWIWEDAAKAADDLDLCSDYERVASSLGIPGRKTQWDVTVSIRGELTGTLMATVDARDARQARNAFNDAYGNKISASYTLAVRAHDINPF